jgi:hypothetical protein
MDKKNTPVPHAAPVAAAAYTPLQFSKMLGIADKTKPVPTAPVKAAYTQLQFPKMPVAAVPRFHLQAGFPYAAAPTMPPISPMQHMSPFFYTPPQGPVMPLFFQPVTSRAPPVTTMPHSHYANSSFTRA